MKKSRKNVKVSSNQLITADSAKRIRNNILPVIFIILILVIFVIVFVKVLDKMKKIDNNLNVSYSVNVEC